MNSNCSSNHCVQATPGCALCLFLSQRPGAPDAERSAGANHKAIYEQENA